MADTYKLLSVKLLSASSVQLQFEAVTALGTVIVSPMMVLTVSGANAAAKKLDAHSKICAMIAAYDAKEAADNAAPAATPIDDIVGKVIDATTPGTITVVG